MIKYQPGQLVLVRVLYAEAGGPVTAGNFELLEHTPIWAVVTPPPQHWDLEQDREFTPVEWLDDRSAVLPIAALEDAHDEFIVYPFGEEPAEGLVQLAKWRLTHG